MPIGRRPRRKGIFTTEITEDTEEGQADQPQMNTDGKEVESFGFSVLSCGRKDTKNEALRSRPSLGL
jgi:hypothetical protein